MSRRTVKKSRLEQEARNRLHDTYACWVHSKVSVGLTREETIKLVRGIVVNPTQRRDTDEEEMRSP